MDQENYVEGCSMKRPPLLEADGFCFWKARFETYVKAKVTAIEKAKELATLPLDELIANLKVYEMVLDNNGVASKTIKEKGSQEEQPNPSISNNDVDIVDLKKENGELLKFNQDFSKTYEILLQEKRALEKEHSKLFYKVNELKLEVKKLARSKEVVKPCKKCVILTKEVKSLKSNVSKLQDKALKFSKFKKSSVVLDDMLSRHKLSQDKEGLGFSNNDKTTSLNLKKPIVFVKESQKENSSNCFVKPVVPQTHFANTQGSQVCLKCNLLPDDWIMDSGCTKHMTGNRRLFTLYKAYDGGRVVFGSNLKGKVVGGGYSQTSKAYIVLNKETIRIEKSLNVTFDESLPEPKLSSLVEDDRIIEPVVQDLVRSPSLEANASEPRYPISVEEARGQPIEQVIGELNERTVSSKTKQP
ncbi:hypothetical protein Tco_0986242 [Tanacetum coccineum]